MTPGSLADIQLSSPIDLIAEISEMRLLLSTLTLMQTSLSLSWIFFFNAELKYKMHTEKYILSVQLTTSTWPMLRSRSSVSLGVLFPP